MYQGYREEAFYWEFVNTVRKFLLVAINVFLAPYSASYRAMSALIVLLTLYRLQMWLQPYKLKVNNELENSAMVAVGFTIFGGVLFIKANEEVVAVEVFTFVLIIVINLVFFLFWFYLLSKTYEKHEAGKRVAMLLRIVLFRKDNDTIFTTEGESETPVEYNNRKANKKRKKLILQLRQSSIKNNEESK